MASRATPPPFDPYAPKNASQNILLADSGIQLSMIVGVKAGGLHAELDVVVSGMVTNTNHHIFRPDFRPVRQDKAAQHPVLGFPKNDLSSRSDLAAIGKVHVGAGPFSKG